MQTRGRNTTRRARHSWSGDDLNRLQGHRRDASSRVPIRGIHAYRREEDLLRCGWDGQSLIGNSSTARCAGGLGRARLSAAFADTVCR